MNGSEDADTVSGRRRRVALGLGSNLGDRLGYLQSAIDCLRTSGLTDLRASAVYETEPVGGPDQDNFLNAVVIADSAHDPEEILEICQRCEQQAERVRAEHWGPRTLDIDVLAVDGIRTTTATLTLPHPLSLSRAFVLVPWSEVDPDFEVDPGVTVADAVQRVDVSGIVRTEFPLTVGRP